MINTSNTTNQAMRLKNQSNNYSVNSKKALDESLEKVAESFETQFIQQMLSEMKKTVPLTEENSAAMNYYDSLMDSERAQAMMKQGIGIKELILKQIAPHLVKANANNIARSAISKGEGHGN